MDKATKSTIIIDDFTRYEIMNYRLKRAGFVDYGSMKIKKSPKERKDDEINLIAISLMNLSKLKN